MIKKLLSTTIIVSSILGGIANAEEINVLRSGSNSGTNAPWSEALEEILVDSGYKVNRVNTNTCKESEQWYQRNKDKSFVTIGYTYYFLTSEVDPQSPAACNIPVNEDTFGGFFGQAPFFVCSNKASDDNLEIFLSEKSKGLKVGVHKEPTHVKIVESILEDIGFQGDVMEFVNATDLRTAFSTNDVQYLLYISEYMVKDMDPSQCFISFGDKKFVEENTPWRESIEDYVSNKGLLNYGTAPFLLTSNVDLDEISKVVHGSDNETQNTLLSNYYEMNDYSFKSYKDLMDSVRKLF